MLHVEVTHEDVEDAVVSPSMPCCACIHVPLPYLFLHQASKHHASELHTTNKANMHAGTGDYKGAFFSNTFASEDN